MPAPIEEPCMYVFQLVMTPGQKLANQKVPIDTDSDFLLTGIHGTSTGDYSINFKLPSGKPFANNQVQKQNLIGTANQPTAIGPSQVYLGASIGPALDLTETSGFANTLEICFSGIRKLRTAAGA